MDVGTRNPRGVEIDSRMKTPRIFCRYISNHKSHNLIMNMNYGELNAQQSEMPRLYLEGGVSVSQNADSAMQMQMQIAQLAIRNSQCSFYVALYVLCTFTFHSR